MSEVIEIKHEPFTAGPWKVIQGVKSLIPLYVAQEDGTCISIPAMHEEIDANARLIAAAPEMYELLQRLIDTDSLTDMGEYYFAGEASHIASQANELLNTINNGQ